MAEEGALPNSHLLHSEETQKDTKEGLYKMHHDGIRQQGAEVSYFVCQLRIVIVIVVIVHL